MWGWALGSAICALLMAVLGSSFWWVGSRADSSTAVGQDKKFHNLEFACRAFALALFFSWLALLVAFGINI
tara:strand:- start:143 stop:355 length:213 start_codon:yes stop_codon:yes gene_type:complete